MKVTQEQLAQFDRDGYLFFPSLFSSDEIEVLADEVPGHDCLLRDYDVAPRCRGRTAPPRTR